MSDDAINEAAAADDDTLWETFRAKWDARDAQRERDEAWMNAQHEAHINELAEVVEAALKERCAPCAPFDTIAHVAVTALEADGVVFARMGSCKDDDDT